MINRAQSYLAKAEESLAGAESELANGRYDNCANRCYYAGFQAAVSALVRASISQPEANRQWGHEFVQAAFVGQLVNRRKQYRSSIRDTLSRALALRIQADHGDSSAGVVEARRMVKPARGFLQEVRVEP